MSMVDVIFTVCCIHETYFCENYEKLHQAKTNEADFVLKNILRTKILTLRGVIKESGFEEQYKEWRKFNGKKYGWQQSYKPLIRQLLAEWKHG